MASAVDVGVVGVVGVGVVAACKGQRRKNRRHERVVDPGRKKKRDEESCLKEHCQTFPFVAVVESHDERDVDVDDAAAAAAGVVAGRVEIETVGVVQTSSVAERKRR